MAAPHSNPLSNSHPRTTALWLILLTGAAALLRLLHISRRSFWADEAFSITLAQSPWPQFLHTLVHDEANMSLYYLLLRLWSRFGEAPGYVRGLSVLAGVLTVPVIYFAGQTLFSHRAGLIAAVLLAVNVFHIQYSREARSYSLAVLLVTCSSLFFVRNVQTRGRHGGIAYVLTSAAAFYAHFFAVLVLLAQLVSWIFLPPPLRRWAQFRNIFIVAVVGVPLMLFIAHHGTSHLRWITHPTPKDVYHLFTSFAGIGLCFVVFVIALAVVARHYWLQRGLNAWPLLFVLTWFLLPIFVTLVMSHWTPIFWPRFLLIGLPPALLLFAHGLALLRPRWLGIAAVVIVVCASLEALGKHYRTPDPENWKAAVAYVAGNAAPGDLLVFAYSYCQAPFDYNRRASQIDLPAMEVTTGLASPGSRLSAAHHLWLICSNGHPLSLPEFRPVPLPTFCGTDIREFEPVNPQSR